MPDSEVGRLRLSPALAARRLFCAKFKRLEEKTAENMLADKIPELVAAIGELHAQHVPR